MKGRVLSLEKSYAVAQDDTGQHKSRRFSRPVLMPFQ
jgi:hypothetical protein